MPARKRVVDDTLNLLPMSKTAKAKFKNTTYTPSTYGTAPGPTLGRVSIQREFEGEMIGTSGAELLTCQGVNAVAYVGSDQFVGMLQGHSGSFVFQHTGILESGRLIPAGYIVPGSGTANLRGIRGTVTISVATDGQHWITLDYNIDHPASAEDGAT